MPRLLDNPDRDFSANPSNDKIDTGIDENLFTSLVAGYSELIDDSQVRFRVAEIIDKAMITTIHRR
jgi:hypothetical protein